MKDDPVYIDIDKDAPPELRENIRRRIAYQETAMEAEQRRKSYDIEIMEALKKLYEIYPRADAFEIDIHEGERVQICITSNKGKELLDYDKLLELGVGRVTLDQALVRHPDSKPFVRIKNASGKRRYSHSRAL